VARSDKATALVVSLFITGAVVLVGASISSRASSPGDRTVRASLDGAATGGTGGTVVADANPGANPDANPGAVPFFDLPSLKSDATRHSLKSFVGKPLVINVFDYTCVPCIRELPMISAAASSHPEIAFLGVHLMLQRRDAQDFVSKLNLSFPVAYDGDGDLAPSIAALPTTIFLDSNGHEVDRVNGPISKDDLAHRLERLKGGIS
jgi:thiol-disulfide isomerase/thioredoxin